MFSEGLYQQIQAQRSTSYGVTTGGGGGGGGNDVDAAPEDTRTGASSGGGGSGDDGGGGRRSSGHDSYDSSNPVGDPGRGPAGQADDSDLNAALNASMRSATIDGGGMGVADAAAMGGMGGDSSVAAPPSFSEAATSGTLDEEQMREQYRIMATHEAAARVKANTGYDPNAKQSASGGESGSGASAAAAAPRPPGPKPREGRPLPGPRPREPPLPPPRINRSILGPIPPGERVPELCSGTLVGPEGGGDKLVQLLRGGVDGEETAVADDEHVVRCLHCKSGLKVKKMASLVRCYVCETVSPATSFRY